MKFQPKTEAQIREEQLLPAGEYDATVIEASDETSAKGSEMIKLTIRVFRDDGRTSLVNDYLLEAMQKKLLHFTAASILSDKYNAGTLCAADCDNADMRVVLSIKTDPTGKYQDQNNVKDYKPREAVSAGNGAISKFDPADIPF